MKKSEAPSLPFSNLFASSCMLSLIFRIASDSFWKDIHWKIVCALSKIKLRYANRSNFYKRGFVNLRLLFFPKIAKLTFSPPGGKLGMLNSRFWSPSLGVVGAVVGLLFMLSRSGPPFCNQQLSDKAFKVGTSNRKNCLWDIVPNGKLPRWDFISRNFWRFLFSEYLFRV